MRAWIIGGCLLLAACGNTAPSAAAQQAQAASAMVPPVALANTSAAIPTPLGDPVEGARVARRVGCDSCHGVGGKGGGLDETTPMGDRVVAPNLTQRRTQYSDAELEALLHRGVTHDGHRVFGMPIKASQHLSEREVRDIIAWMRALPAVDNPGLAQSHFTPGTLQSLLDGTHPYAHDDQPDPGNVPPATPPTEPLALGRHLALTSCSECHGWDLQGDGFDTPPLSVAKAYTPEQFLRLMRSGIVAAGGTSKSGVMSGVAYRFSVMSDAEIAALKTYIDSQ